MKPNSFSVSNAILMPEIAKLLRQGHTVTIPLKGNSMRPYLVHKRDKALLVLPEQQLKVGDVVLAEVTPGRYVLHRLVGIDSCDPSGKCPEQCPSNSPVRIILRGDGNFATEVCNASNVIAVAKAFFRKGNDKAKFVSSISYRIYKFFWMHTLPIRRYLLKLDDIIFHSLKDLNK